MTHFNKKSTLTVSKVLELIRACHHCTDLYITLLHDKMVLCRRGDHVTFWVFLKASVT